jgi:N-acetyl-anhydromuramyl-L-alanine amidase AmpD
LIRRSVARAHRERADTFATAELGTRLKSSAAVAAPASNATPISTPAEITSAQEHLRYMGYDVPQATGTLDLKTKIAIMQFQESIGAQTTGVLTVGQ